MKNELANMIMEMAVGTMGQVYRTYVSEVEGSVDLVHDVERRRLVVVKGENKGKTTKGLLATGQVADVLPALLRRHNRE